MKCNLMGKEIVKYTNKKTGKLNEGISLFYSAPKYCVEGLACDSIWIGKESQFYDDVLLLDLTKPVLANVVNEVQPGNKFPEITAIDILKQ